MKIWVYIIWVLSVTMWAITLILEHTSSKAKEEKQIDPTTFYSFFIIVFLLFTMIGTVLFNIMVYGEVK